MKVEIRASLSAITAAVMLFGCASKPKQDEASDYQRLAENASHQRVCKRQAVSGSRIDSVVCLTEAERKAQLEHADDVMRDIQAHAPMNGPPNLPPPPSPPPPRQ